MSELRAPAIRAVRGDDEAAHAHGWHWGLCWLCKLPDKLVSWVGSSRTMYGEMEIYACGDCQRWWDQASWNAQLTKDFAELTAK